MRLLHGDEFREFRADGELRLIQPKPGVDMLRFT
jgi:hypothetical protein